MSNTTNSAPLLPSVIAAQQQERGGVDNTALEVGEWQLQHCSSSNRIDTLVSLLHTTPREVGLSLFVEWYSSCDNTWWHRRDILILLQRLGSVQDFMQPDAKDFFFALPEPIIVYRGCQEDRVRGLSWTTDRAVAKGFSVGHRGIRVRQPVIATAEVTKEAVFFAVTDREESELVINPRRLRKVRVERIQTGPNTG